MTLTQEERLVIDRYLEGQLSGMELRQFMDRLENNPDFRYAVSFQNLLQEGIQSASEVQLKNEIIRFIDYKKPPVPFGLQLIFLFLLITISGIALWNYTGMDSAHTGKSPFTFSFFHFRDDKKALTEKPTIGMKRLQESKANGSSSTIENSKSKNTEVSGSAAISNSGDQKEETSGGSLPDSSNSNTRESQDITIRKDQLLISRSLSVNEIHTESKKEKDVEIPAASLSKTTVDKLNPAASLVVEDDKSYNYFEVEFWISPVNYKGYKLVRNKIILFGIEEPDAVRLYRVDNQLFLKYGSEFYKLGSSEDFSAYHTVREAEIPASILQ